MSVQIDKYELIPEFYEQREELPDRHEDDRYGDVFVEEETLEADEEEYDVMVEKIVDDVDEEEASLTGTSYEKVQEFLSEVEN